MCQLEVQIAFQIGYNNQLRITNPSYPFFPKTALINQSEQEKL